MTVEERLEALERRVANLEQAALPHQPFGPNPTSRITLRVTSVRVERLQEISEQDAAAEGVSKADVTGWISYRTSFALLWDSINAERAPWASNPWVWVVVFERVLSGGRSE